MAVHSAIVVGQSAVSAYARECLRAEKYAPLRSFPCEVLLPGSASGRGIEPNHRLPSAASLR